MITQVTDSYDLMGRVRLNLRPMTDPDAGRGRLLWDGKRLRQLREAAKMSQVELAERSGVSNTEISRHENNDPTSNPSVDTLGRLALALGVELSSLTMRDGAVIHWLDKEAARARGLIYGPQHQGPSEEENRPRADETGKFRDKSLQGGRTRVDTRAGNASVGRAQAMNDDAAEVPHGTTLEVSDRADFRAAIQSFYDAAGRFDRATTILNSLAAGLVLADGKTKDPGDPGSSDGEES